MGDGRKLANYCTKCNNYLTRNHDLFTFTEVENKADVLKAASGVLILYSNRTIGSTLSFAIELTRERFLLTRDVRILLPTTTANEHIDLYSYALPPCHTLWLCNKMQILIGKDYLTTIKRQFRCNRLVCI